MEQFEGFFIKMREHGIEVPIFQDAINEFHAKLESRNQYAETIRNKIQQVGNYSPINEMLENDDSIYVIDRGNYMHHSLCLHKEEDFNIDKLYGANNNKTGKRVIDAFMTIKEANSVNPFAKCREIKLKRLLDLMNGDSKYEAILVNYASDEDYLIIPADILEKN